MQETVKLESIDEILRNLNANPEYYNKAKEQEFERFDSDE